MNGEQPLKRAFLHIGLSKTGTTAIQMSLSGSRSTLLKNGLLYPGSEDDHIALLPSFHQLGPGHFRFANAGISPEEALKQSQRFLHELENQARDFSGDILMSTEYLQNMNAAAWKKMYEYVSSLGFEPHIICYVRHPVSHATSAIQQQIKMGSGQLETLLEEPRWPMARPRLGNALGVFPREHVHVRRMEDARKEGLESDILQTAGYTGSLAEIHRTKANTSLSMTGVLIADARNRLHDGSKTAEKVREHLTSIGGPKFTLPQRTARKVMRQAQDDLAWLNDTFGISFSDIEVTTGKQDRLTPEAADDIVRLLMDLAR